MLSTHNEYSHRQRGLAPSLRRLVRARHFFFPHMTPALSSCSTSRKSASIAGGPCCAIWRMSARMIAELLIERPKKSEASRLRCWRKVSSLWVRAWERIRRGSFERVVCGRAIRELITHLKTICQRSQLASWRRLSASFWDFTGSGIGKAWVTSSYGPWITWGDRGA